MIEFEAGKQYSSKRHKVRILKRIKGFVRVKLYPQGFESWCPLIHFPEMEVVEYFGIRFYANKE